MDYLDFEVTILPRREDRFPLRVKSPAGDGHDDFYLPFDEAELANLAPSLSLAIVRGTTRSPRGDGPPPETMAPPETVGARLFESLFQGKVGSLFERSLGMVHGTETGLRIKLRIDPDESPDLARLAGLPWEFLYRQDTRDFLSLSMHTPVVRYLEVARPTEPLRLEKPLRILFVLASPHDQDPLDLEREKELIEKALAGQRQTGQVEFKVLEHARARDLLHELDEATYHVVHFMGHGDFDLESGQGQLCLEDEEGRTDMLSAPKLMTLLRDRKSVRLVFLNACQTAAFAEDGERHDAFMGVAPALVLGGVTAVVAMQFPISDEAAMAFSEGLYGQLAKGRPVDEAVSKARQAVQVRTDGQEWGTPVLFMRTSDGRIFDVVEAAPGGVPLVPVPVETKPEPADTESVSGDEEPDDGEVFLRLGPLALSRGAALGIGAGVLVLIVALVAGLLLLRPRPVSYLQLVLDNGPVGGEQGLEEISQALEAELRRSLPDAALALRAFGAGCGDTVQLVDFSRGNAGEVMAALLEVHLVPEAPLVEAIRQALNDMLGLPGNAPKAVVVMTWGTDTCGSDLEEALEDYRGQLGTAVNLYLISVDTAGLPSSPHIESVPVDNMMEARRALGAILDAMGRGELPSLPPTLTPSATPEKKPTPVPPVTPTPTVPVLPTREPTATPTATVSDTPTRTPRPTSTWTPRPTARPTLPESLDQPWNVAWKGLDARGRELLGSVIATGEKLVCTRQEFHYGFLFWCDRQRGRHRSGPERPDMVYAVEYRGRHRAWYLEDTWTEEEGEVDCPLEYPDDWPALAGGFRKVWCEQRDIRNALEEPVKEVVVLPKLDYRTYGTGPGIVEFEGGHILWDTGTDKLWVLLGGLGWQSFELGTFTATPRPVTGTVSISGTVTVTATMTLVPSQTP